MRTVQAATLLHAGVRDELLERDVDVRLRAIADVLNRASRQEATC